MDSAPLPVLMIGNDVNNEPFGSLVEVDVKIAGLAAILDSYRFDVAFTPGVLSFSGADRGTVQGFDNTAGTVTGIARSNVGLNAGGTLVKLRFKAIGAGTSVLSIPPTSVTLLCKIPFTKKDGVVFVFDPPRT